MPVDAFVAFSPECLVPRRRHFRSRGDCDGIFCGLTGQCGVCICCTVRTALWPVHLTFLSVKVPHLIFLWEHRPEVVSLVSWGENEHKLVQRATGVL